MMIDITDPKLPDWKKYLFSCDCDNNHFIQVNWWYEEDYEDWPGFLEITSAVYPRTIRERIKKAFDVLRGRVCYYDGVILDEETANGLGEIIAEQKIRKGKEDGKVQSATEV